MKKKTLAITLALAMTLSCGTVAFADRDIAPSSGETITTDTAYHQNFFSNVSKLAGDDGIPDSEHVDWEDRGIALGFDVDGNSVQAVDEQDLRYFDGKYYLYGEDFLYATFNHAVAVDKNPVITNTGPNSFHRYGGMNIYSSDDMMNWTLEDTVFLQEADTGWLYTIKKPRVVYSEETGLYVLWFLNSHTVKESIQQCSTAPTPLGPWSEPFVPTIAEEIKEKGADWGPDFEIVEGPDGSMYHVCSHNGIRVSKLNAECTGIVEQTVIPKMDRPLAESLAGGIGLHWNKNETTGELWWYITGSGRCGNCVASSFYYIMCKDDPINGTWISPDTKQPALNPETKEPDPVNGVLTAGKISELVMYSQIHSSKMLPDKEGNMHAVIPATHYYSSNLKNQEVEGGAKNQFGESTPVISGLFLIPLEYNKDGTLKNIDYFEDVVEIPLAKEVTTTVPKNYMPYAVITETSSVSQSWTIEAGETVASVQPSVFQWIQQKVGDNWKKTPYKPIEPFVDAPLHAKVKLPDGTVQEWDVDARSVTWAPTRIALNLDKPYVADKAGTITLTLSTKATIGKYGVAVGTKSDLLPDGVYTTVNENETTTWPNAEILVTTYSDAAGTPVITEQPHSLVVMEGDYPGFYVKAEGVGLGYQWYKDGEIILAPTGWDESVGRTFRLSKVTTADNGVYSVDVFNTAGKVSSVEVTLTVVKTQDELKALLQKLVDDSKGCKAGVISTDSDASSVTNGTKFVSTAVMETLNDAIATAEKALEGDTEALSTSYCNVLNAAVTAFQEDIQTGTYVTPSTQMATRLRTVLHWLWS